jgi:hypothetical protein
MREFNWKVADRVAPESSDVSVSVRTAQGLLQVDRGKVGCGFRASGTTVEAERLQAELRVLTP